MPPPFDYYKSNLQKFGDLLLTNKRHRTTVAIARLICFLIIVASLYSYFKTGNDALILAAVVSIVAFGWLVRKAVNLKNTQAFLQQLNSINKNELAVAAYRPNMFPDGNEYLNFDSYLFDLDVFGKSSVFHVINRTTTSHGKDFLANTMKELELDNKTIEESQEAIRTLSGQPDVCQRCIAVGLTNSEEKGNLYHVGQWLRSASRVKNVGWIGFMRFLLPVVNLSGFLYYLSTDNYIPFTISVVLSWICISIYSKHILAQHTLLGKKQAILEQYAQILQMFHQVKPKQSSMLQQLSDTAAAAHQEISSLSRLTGLFDQRMNMVVNIFLNSFLLYDIHLIIALEKWKEKNSEKFASWIESVGKIESLISYSVFAYNHSEYIYPNVTTSHTPVLNTAGLGHPLLKSEELVVNDLHPPEHAKVFLITGSNMSGKTTFLRALGVNLILASCGAPVRASSFDFTPMNILTSIRINDSLQDHTSYFMAELKRLSFIIHELQRNQRSIVLIDEILRGTNSDDKTNGSAGYIRKLMAYNCLSFFATHDLALSQLQHDFPEQVKNYCFESTIENGELLFDYKLRQGVAKNKNASFLMEKMGII